MPDRNSIPNAGIKNTILHDSFQCIFYSNKKCCFNSLKSWKYSTFVLRYRSYETSWNYDILAWNSYYSRHVYQMIISTILISISWILYVNVKNVFRKSLIRGRPPECEPEIEEVQTPSSCSGEGLEEAEMGCLEDQTNENSQTKSNIFFFTR